MKFGPVTKLHKRNTVTPKTFDNDVISANGDIIVSSALWSIRSHPETGFRTHDL